MAKKAQPQRRRFGSIRQLPSGRFQARYPDAGGQPRKAPQTFETYDEAEDWLNDQRTDIRRGVWRDPDLGAITFAEWAEQYMAGALHKRASTKYRDQSILNRRLVPTFGHLALRDIRPVDVREFVQILSTEYAPSTVETEYALFRTIMQAAVNADLLTISPCRGVNLPKDKRPDRRGVTLEQLDKLADAAVLAARKGVNERKDYGPMIWTVGLLGLRWGEVSGLRVGDLELSVKPPRLHVRVALADVGGHVELDDTKTEASYRHLVLPPTLGRILGEHLLREGKTGSPGALVFTAARGGPLHASDFRDTVWHPARKAAGQPELTFHQLRHSAAGLMRQLGMNTQLIARRLGHADDRTTSRDYGWVPDELDVAAANALERALRKGKWHARGTPGAASDAS